MTTISAKMIEDSISPAGKRLSTLLLVYPRWIHAEGRTHRVLSLGEDEFETWEPRTPSLMEDRNLSRNAASSRAIPIERMIQAVRENPAEPLYWGRNQQGMQAAEELTGDALEYAKREWRLACADAIGYARRLALAGAHKQIVNRILEPYMHIRVLVSGTEWANFFALRDHPDAEPHIRMLAQAIKSAMAESTPTLLQPGQWHMPYVLPTEKKFLKREECLLLSGARCASLSYQTVDGQQMTLERAQAIEGKLMGAPMHASPFEHQATPDEGATLQGPDGPETMWAKPHWHGNFIGWCQHRKMLPGEAVW